jgi:hypothetical protein
MSNEEPFDRDENKAIKEKEKQPLEQAPIVPLQNAFKETNHIESIAKNAAKKITEQATPEQLIDLLKTFNDQEAKLATIKEENRHKEVIKREETQQQQQSSSENTKRFIIGLLGGIVIVGFTYSGVTKDSTLTDKIITGLFGVVGGAGGVSWLSKQDKTEPPKE